MNFRTTLFLLIAVLALSGAAFWFARERKAAPKAPAAPALLNVNWADVTRIELTSSDNLRVVIDRHASGWRLSSPVTAPADASAVEGLLSSLSALRSAGQVTVEPTNATALGLQSPSNTVLVVSTDRTVRMTVGARTGTGGNVYVRIDERSEAVLVPALLLDDLDKPAAHFRDSQLFPLRSNEVRWLRLTDPQTAQSVELWRDAEQWRVRQPAPAPADDAEVSDLIFALTGLRATEFVAEDASAQPVRFGLDEPQLIVHASAVDPTTQPAATQATPTVVRFGKFDDLLKRNVYVAVGDRGAVAKSAAIALQTLRRSPLELRDRRLFRIDPATVRQVTVAIEPAPSTQPLSNAAVVTFTRAAPVSTQPSTAPSTQPKWQREPALPTAPDDAGIDPVLALFNPLRVDRYLPALNFVAAPGATVLTIESLDGSKHVIRFLDGAVDDPTSASLAQSGDLNFELPSFIAQRVRALVDTP